MKAIRGATTVESDSEINIALDGPAGSGKSTVSKLIAKKLDILCLDTGAMYRACALKCYNSGVDCSDAKSVERVIKNVNLEVKYENGEQHTFLDGTDVSEKIREPHISMLASNVSVLPCVRNKMVEIQRRIAEKTSCILDGRDIGTNVLPNAEYKFFLTASAEVRAKRRYDELTAKGHKVNLDELTAEIIKRDEQDSNRKTAPLIKADDAVLVDTSEMNIDEVIAYILNIIREQK